MFGMDEKKKLGIGILTTGLICYLLGIILLFDRVLFILANLCFFGGLYFIQGFMGMISFFLKKSKWKGTGFFVGGFLLIVIVRWSFVGFLMQIYGIFVVFKSFIPFLYASACNAPFIGKFIRQSHFLQKIFESLNKRKPPV